MNPDSAAGLNWKSVGAAEPTVGRALNNSALAFALESKNEFTEQELMAFGPLMSLLSPGLIIKDLRFDDFIKSGDTYFNPADSIKDRVDSKDSELNSRGVDPVTGSEYPRRKTKPLEYFLEHRMTKDAKLNKAEVVGLRLYTG